MTLRVVTVTYAEQAAMFRSCLVEHAIVVGVGRTVGDTMLENVMVDSRTPLVEESLLLSAAFYFLYREIIFGSVFSMEEGGG